jgi:hypothetical protein
MLALKLSTSELGKSQRRDAFFKKLLIQTKGENSRFVRRKGLALTLKKAVSSRNKAKAMSRYLFKRFILLLLWPR